MSDLITPEFLVDDPFIDEMFNFNTPDYEKSQQTPAYDVVQ